MNEPEPFPASRQIRRPGTTNPWSIDGFVDNVFESLGRFNVLVSPRPWRLFELNDQSLVREAVQGIVIKENHISNANNSVPPLIRQKVQDILTRQWNTYLPFIQSQAPSAHAAEILHHHLTLLGSSSSSTPTSSSTTSPELYTTAKQHTTSSFPSSVLQTPPITIIDFCSGGGGPVPAIESILNTTRKRAGQTPIQFQLSDLYPNLDAWRQLASNSSHLSFLSQPVDARAPPPAAKSGNTRVFRTFFLAFHHLDHPAAIQALKSTLNTADGFAIIELQDRRITSFVLMVLEFFMVYPIVLLYFWHDPVVLLLTFGVPVLPFILAWDGAMSSLRTRTFDEVVGMADFVHRGEKGEGYGMRPMAWGSYDGGNSVKRAVRGEWVIEGGRRMHSWPIGHMNWVVGRRERKDGGAGRGAGAGKGAVGYVVL